MQVNPNIFIQLIAKNESIPKLMDEVHKHFPKSFEEVDGMGNLPIHTAVLHNGDPIIVNHLLTTVQHPAIHLSKPNKLGRLPLHLAATGHSMSTFVEGHHPKYHGPEASKGIEQSRVEILKKLGNLYSMAFKTPDVFGCLPLHIACLNNGSLEMIKSILEAYPSAINYSVHLPHRGREPSSSSISTRPPINPTSPETEATESDIGIYNDDEFTERAVARRRERIISTQQKTSNRIEKVRSPSSGKPRQASGLSQSLTPADHQSAIGSIYDILSPVLGFASNTADADAKVAKTSPGSTKPIDGGSPLAIAGSIFSFTSATKLYPVTDESISNADLKSSLIDPQDEATKYSINMNMDAGYNAGEYDEEYDDVDDTGSEFSLTSFNSFFHGMWASQANANTPEPIRQPRSHFFPKSTTTRDDDAQSFSNEGGDGTSGNNRSAWSPGPEVQQSSIVLQAPPTQSNTPVKPDDSSVSSSRPFPRGIIGERPPISPMSLSPKSVGSGTTTRVPLGSRSLIRGGSQSSQSSVPTNVRSRPILAMSTSHGSSQSSTTSIPNSAETKRRRLQNLQGKIGLVEGSLPLHLVSRSCHLSPDGQVMQYILSKYPRAVEHKDGQGNLPLHAIVASESSFQLGRACRGFYGNFRNEFWIRLLCILELVRVFPQSIFAANQDMDTPYDIVRANYEQAKSQLGDSVPYRPEPIASPNSALSNDVGTAIDPIDDRIVGVASLGCHFGKKFSLQPRLIASPHEQVNTSMKFEEAVGESEYEIVMRLLLRKDTSNQDPDALHDLNWMARRCAVFVSSRRTTFEVAYDVYAKRKPSSNQLLITPEFKILLFPIKNFVDLIRALVDMHNSIEDSLASIQSNAGEKVRATAESDFIATKKSIWVHIVSFI